MAIKIQTYWKTNDIGSDQLKQAVTSARNQDYKIYELFKHFGTLTDWDIYDLYNELYKPIQPSSVGRSRNTLLRNNAIVYTGNIPGPMNRPISLYTIVDNPPSVLKSFNKSVPLSISIDVILNDEGQLDIDKMIDDLTDKSVSLINKYNL
jgi:hypothetical protein